MDFVLLSRFLGHNLLRHLHVGNPIPGISTFSNFLNNYRRSKIVLLSASNDNMILMNSMSVVSRLVSQTRSP